MARLVGAGALVAILGTFFSLAYAGSRQFYHLAQAGLLSSVFRRVNARQAPVSAVYLVAGIALATAAFPPNSAMVVFIFLISVSHALLLAAFLRLRQREPALVRSYRALGGAPVAVVALLLSLTVMVSCYRLEVRALQIAMGAILVLIAQFLWLKPARVRVT
jgi:amino acid transporter